MITHVSLFFVELVRSTSANTVIPVLDKVLSTFSTPDILKSDNGAPFNSGQFHAYAENMGFKHRKVTPYWPRANVLAHNRPACGNQQVHKWQSRGAYMAVNRHRSGPYVAINRHIHGSQQAHTWQSTGTYPAVNRHMVHTWQLFRHTKGTEMAIKRSRNGTVNRHC